MGTQELELRQLIAETSKRIDRFKRNALARQIRQMEIHSIDLVLDVGANTGQYAQRLRKAGYVGDIVSFEPVSSAFASLQRKTRKDVKWSAAQLALGAREGTTLMAVSGDSRASSVKPMLELHQSIAPYFSTVSQESVDIRTLDALWNGLAPEGRRVYLKIDAQGAERDIIEGAEQSMARLRMVQLELSLLPLYEDSLLLPAGLELMTVLGFELVSVEYGFCHPCTGQMLQVDGVFARR